MNDDLNFRGRCSTSSSRHWGNIFIPLGRCRSIGALAAIALLLIPTASRASSYSATGSLAYQLGFNYVPLDGYTQTNGSGASGEAEGLATYLSVSSSSSADSSGLRAAAMTVYDKPDISGSSATYTASANSSAIASWDDFVITGPSGTDTVSLSLNLYLDGAFVLVGDETPSASFPAVASGNVSVGILVSGNNVGSGQYSQSIRNGVITPESNGVLSGFTGEGVFRSLVFNAPVNTPFTLELSLGITAGIGVQNNQSAQLESSVDFNNTLTFVTDGPVFNLPSDYTINSAGANIVNNVAVPEPSTIFLGLAAIPFLQLCRRRSRR